MPSCFIAMPITTVAPELYSNDIDHFSHVLRHLFIPAIEAAGFDPILPMAEGSDVIHAEIIKHIEQSDLVLCDMSSLNPNVFFELGVRTAVNKPLCMVKDEITAKVPFDTTVVNHHTYRSSLAPWILGDEVKSLSTHIEKSFERSNGQNTMWRHFSLSARAELIHDRPNNTNDVFELLSMKIDALSRQIEEQPLLTAYEPDPSSLKGTLMPLIKYVGSKLDDEGIEMDAINIPSPGHIEIEVQKLPSLALWDELIKHAHRKGTRLKIEKKNPERSAK